MIDMQISLSEQKLSDLGQARPSASRRQRAAERRCELQVSVDPPIAIDLFPTVDRNVIPLLHAALQKNLRRPQHPLIRGEVALHEDVADLADRMIGGRLEDAFDRIDALRVSGRSLESIYLKLLAPTACHLRDLWSKDYCGFADLTFALCNLQGVLRRYARDFQAEATSADNGSRVLVVTPSGDGADIMTPVFGLMLMSQFFRRDGWDASIERDLTCGHFRETAGEWFDMVEVLAANDGQLDEIASGIRTIRRGSPNPSIGVIVCGQIFSERPDYIGLVGADLMASDPLSSLSQAKSFLSRGDIAKSATVMKSQTQIRRLA
jgi:hypothetical protein